MSLHDKLMLLSLVLSPILLVALLALTAYLTFNSMPRRPRA